MAALKQPYSRNSLDIRLAESVIFLRADPTGRNRNLANSPPAVVRGLLTLTLTKPTKISSIEVELVCKTSTAWPEGVGARRIDITEDHKVYEQSYVFFDATRPSSSGHHTRRTLSVGPGIAFDRERSGYGYSLGLNNDAYGDDGEGDDDRSEAGASSESTSEGQGTTSSRFHRSFRFGRTSTGDEPERRGRGLTRDQTGPPPSQPRRRGLGRHLSVDQAHFQPSFVEHRDTQLPPTPPYSPIASPVQPLSRMSTLSEPPTHTPAQTLSQTQDPAQAHVHMHTIGGAAGGQGEDFASSPAQSLEEFRRNLRAGMGNLSDPGPVMQQSDNQIHASISQSASTSTSASGLNLRIDTGGRYQRMSLDGEAEFVVGSSTGTGAGDNVRRSPTIGPVVDHAALPVPEEEAVETSPPTSPTLGLAGGEGTFHPNTSTTSNHSGNSNHSGSNHSNSNNSNEDQAGVGGREAGGSGSGSGSGGSNSSGAGTIRGRRHKRFSFASVSNAFMGAVKGVRSVSHPGRDITPPRSSPDPRDRDRRMSRDTVGRRTSQDTEGRFPLSPIRGRTSVDAGVNGPSSPPPSHSNSIHHPHLPPQHLLSPSTTTTGVSSLAAGAPLSHVNSNVGSVRSTLGRVTGVLRLDGSEGKEYGDGWKEFRSGVYTYPISFAIPINASPTITCDFGSVSWRLKAYAHRPGTFKQKLSASEEVLVVGCPGEDDTEETESIVVERQWDDQMQYLIAISGRSFAIGGVIPVSLTFMPWTKMKIFRLAVVIEERIDYLTNFKRIARSDAITRIPLISLQMPGRDVPLFPLAIDDVSDFKKTPLWELYAPSDSEPELDPLELSEIASGFMGPGPWKIQKELKLPKSCDVLHFTNKNKKSNIIVTHLLKIIFRVQRGDDEDLDPGSGKRKLYDIVVQTPVHILSCLCSPDYTSLPPYSGLQVLPAPSCRCERGRRTRRGISSPPYSPSASGTSLNAHHIHPQSPPPAPPPTAISPVPPANSHALLHSPGLQHHHSNMSTSTADSSSDGHLGNGNNPHDSACVQYERLITGQETEVGEAPPDYESVTAWGR